MAHSPLLGEGDSADRDRRVDGIVERDALGVGRVECVRVPDAEHGRRLTHLREDRLEARHEPDRAAPLGRRQQRTAERRRVDLVAAGSQERPQVVVVAAPSVRDAPAHAGLELLGEHGLQGVGGHLERAAPEHEGVAVGDCARRYDVARGDVDLDGRVDATVAHAQVGTPVGVLVVLPDGLDAFEGVLHAVARVRGANLAQDALDLLLPHGQGPHSRVHVHGGPSRQPDHRGDEQAALEDEVTGVRARLQAGKQTLEEVHLQHLLRAQPVAPRDVAHLAAQAGIAPYGGVGIGLERLTMILAGTDNIRDVVAFPTTNSSLDLMSEAPGTVDKEQLDVLGIEISARER